MSEATVAKRLARWVLNLQPEDLSSEAVIHAKYCMLDTLGVQLRGATLPWVQPVYRCICALGGNKDATVTFHGDRISAPYAAYVNSTFSYSCELQHHGSWGSAHAGVNIVPAVQALGEQLGCTGLDVIAAMVAGYEVQGRLGAVLFKPAVDRHFHPESVLGVFGSAASAGKLLGLDEEQLAHAFAIAGSHASGIMEYDQTGGEAKRIHGAIAVRSGIQSALLAKEGFTGPPTVFEGHRGVFASFGGCQLDSEQVFSNIGHPYCITQCRFRVYPTMGTCHNTLDIVSGLIKKHSFEYRDVESIRVGIREDAVGHVGTNKRPHDVISAQASMGFSLGVLLVKGSNSLEMYIDPELWQNPEILSVADKLQAYALDKVQGYSQRVEAHPFMTQVEIKLKDGRVLEGQLEDIQPVSFEGIEAKVRGLAGVMLPAQQVEQVMETVAHLEEAPNVSQLVHCLQKHN